MAESDHSEFRSGRPVDGNDIRGGSGVQQLEIFERHRSILFSIAYRMLGSVADAEDMLQEAFIRWQQSSKEEEVQSPQAFLVTVVSRLCINHLQSARVRREQYIGQWLPEPLLTGPEGSMEAQFGVDGTLSMAFLLLLERLSPMERAVFLLREVFDYDYSDIARIVGQNLTSCRQVLRRARQHIAAERPRFQSSPEQRQAILHEFLRATSEGNLSRLLVLLSKDVVLHSDGGGRGPALPREIHGADKVARGLIGASRKFVPRNLVICPAQINGEWGIISYRDGRPYSVLALDFTDQRVRRVYIMSNPDKLAHLPALSLAMNLRISDDEQRLGIGSPLSITSPLSTRTSEQGSNPFSQARQDTLSEPTGCCATSADYGGLDAASVECLASTFPNQQRLQSALVRPFSGRCQSAA